jgi:hypothetical protein
VSRAASLTGWGLLAVGAAAWLALVEVFWLPLRIGGVLMPVSVLAAVVGNLLLVEHTFRRSGSRVVALLPAATWVVVAIGAAIRRPEGDLVLVGGGGLGVVGLAFLLCGVVAASFAVARVLGRPPSVAVAPSTVRRAADPAGSGTGGAR